jgi:hypothetical protein
MGLFWFLRARAGCHRFIVRFGLDARGVEISRLGFAALLGFASVPLTAVVEL